MSNRRTLEQQIESVREEKKQKENRLNELLQKQRDKERKARNHRLCERAGFIESELPDTITLTNEQFYSFIKKTLLTNHSRNILSEIAAKNSEATAGGASAALENGAVAPKVTETSMQNVTPPTVKAAEPKPGGNPAGGSRPQENPRQGS